MPMLYQLSYSPSEFEICSKVNTRTLAILGRLHPQIDAATSCHELARQKVATVKLVAVRRYEIDLVLRVVATLIPGWCAP
jgi:hypothetical protein